MTTPIGKGAPAEKKESAFSDSYDQYFKRYDCMGKIYTLAEKLSCPEMDLMNPKPAYSHFQSSGIGVHVFSDLDSSSGKSMILAVGRPETGFYQVPIIKLAGGKAKAGIDVIISGHVDGNGKAASMKPAKLTEISSEEYGVGMDNAERIYCAALVPKSPIIGEDVLVAGYGRSGKEVGFYGKSMFSMAVNGFLLKRKIVGHADRNLIPIMYPGKDDTERFLRLTEIFTDKAVQKLESEGVYPGLTFIDGTFKEKHRFDGCLRMCLESPSLESRYMPEGKTKSASAGRVGVGVGAESDVRYGSIDGDITSIDRVLGVHMIGIEDRASYKTVRSEIEKLM